MLLGKMNPSSTDHRQEKDIIEAETEIASGNLN
jgi:hypothetical protein